VVREEPGGMGREDTEGGEWDFFFKTIIVRDFIFISNAPENVWWPGPNSTSCEYPCYTFKFLTSDDPT